jgi:hypothetical protein
MGETPMPREESMDAFKIAVKFYVQDSSFLMKNEFVPIFHSWIQQEAIADHVLIDVADYAHVKDGPGMLLVSHEANFYADEFDGRLGLTYSRKHPADGTFADRVRQAVGAAIEASAKLQSDPRVEGRLVFKTDELLITLNDRLLAPNTAETFKAVEPELRQVLREIYGNAQLKLEQQSGERNLFAVRVHATGAPANITDLQSRLTAPSR